MSAPSPASPGAFTALSAGEVVVQEPRTTCACCDPRGGWGVLKRRSVTRSIAADVPLLVLLFIPFSLIFLPRLELYLAARAKRRQAEGGSKGAAASEGKAPAQPSTPPKNQDTKAPGMKEDASASAAAPETLTEV